MANMLITVSSVEISPETALPVYVCRVVPAGFLVDDPLGYITISVPAIFTDNPTQANDAIRAAAIVAATARGFATIPADTQLIVGGVT